MQINFLLIIYMSSKICSNLTIAGNLIINCKKVNLNLNCSALPSQGSPSPGNLSDSCCDTETIFPCVLGEKTSFAIVRSPLKDFTCPEEDKDGNLLVCEGCKNNSNKLCSYCPKDTRPCLFGTGVILCVHRNSILK